MYVVTHDDVMSSEVNGLVFVEVLVARIMHTEYDIFYLLLIKGCKG